MGELVSLDGGLLTVERECGRRVAQLAEHPDYTGEVAGSTPAPPTKYLGAERISRRQPKKDKTENL